MEISGPDQIRNLLGRYCRLIDAGDFAGVGRLLGQAALLAEDGTEVARGPEAIADLYAALVKVDDAGSPRTQHLVTNIELASEPDGSVTAYSSFVVLQATDSLALQPVATGRYVDRFARDLDGAWAFSQRQFSIGLTGDLSQHMAFGLS